MKKTSKRITGIALSALMMVSAIPATNSIIGGSTPLITGITANAADYSTAYHYRTINGNDYIYACGLIFKITKKATSQTNHGTVSIVGLHSSSSNYSYKISLPSYLQYNLRRYDITSVDSMASYGKNTLKSDYYTKLKSIDLTQCSKLTEFAKNAFEGCSELTTVSMPASLKKIGDYAFKNCKALSDFYIAGNNSYFKVQDSILYSYNMKKLIQYPAARNGSSLAIPASVNSIADGAFDNLKYLNRITFDTPSAQTTSFRNDVYPNGNKQIDFDENQIKVSFKNSSQRGSDYWQVDVICPGDDLLINIPKKSTDADGYNHEINPYNIKVWAVNHALMANSLKELTGYSNNTLTLDFYNKDVGYYAATNSSYNNPATIKFGTEHSKVEIDLIKNIQNNNNIFRFCTIHEFGHAYKFAKNNSFYNSYYFDTSKGVVHNGDEFFTNVRSLTAMQNCSDISRFLIQETNTDKTPNTLETRTFGEIYNLRHPKTDDYIYYFAKGLVSIGNWDTLETFYSGTNTIDGSYAYDSDINKKYADALKQYTGFTPSTARNKDYLRFVNGLRHLYLISWCGNRSNNGNTNSFVYFVDQIFTISKNTNYGINKEVSGREFIKNLSDYYFK